MSPDSMIVQFIGSLLLALLTGSWSALPADRLPEHLPTPVAFAAEWHPAHDPGNRLNTIIVLQDGATRFGATSSIVSPARSAESPAAD